MASARAQDPLRRVPGGRTCNKRAPHDFFIATFGLSADAPLPTNVELISCDQRSGVFDYYAREDDQWQFFGSSKDYVSEGYDSDNGACVPKAASTRRCATCHVGGGLVMKRQVNRAASCEAITGKAGQDRRGAYTNKGAGRGARWSAKGL